MIISVSYQSIITYDLPLFVHPCVMYKEQMDVIDLFPPYPAMSDEYAIYSGPTWSQDLVTP